MATTNSHHDLQTLLVIKHHQIITPPARRAWRSYKFASLDFSVFFFFGVESWAAEQRGHLSTLYKNKTGS